MSYLSEAKESKECQKIIQLAESQGFQSNFLVY